MLHDALTDLRAAILEGSDPVEVAAELGREYSLNPSLILRKLAESAGSSVETLAADLRERALHASKTRMTRLELDQRAELERRAHRAQQAKEAAAIAEFFRTYRPRH